MGDLSENADYIQAKEEQGFLEGSIQELEKILHNVVIIDEKTKTTGKVDIGSTVTVQESNSLKKHTLLLDQKKPIR